jgi:long-chain acyl-CoA synthetase
VVVGFAVLVEGGEASETVLRDYCRERLAGYKVPRRVIVSNDLPRSSTGKLLKRRLVELL